MPSIHVFCYGTLITGALDASIDRTLARLCITRREAWIRGRLYDLGPYPGARPAARRSERIHGQVMTFGDAAILPVLDRYEGVDPRAPERGDYRRDTTVATLLDGGTVRAEVYWYQGGLGRARRLAQGDWRRRAR